MSNIELSGVALGITPHCFSIYTSDSNSLLSLVLKPSLLPWGAGFPDNSETWNNRRLVCLKVDSEVDFSSDKIRT